MITHKQFIDKWEGKRYKEPGTKIKPPYQCVSLIKLYCQEVYGIKGLSFGGSAINGWDRKGNLDQFFDRVEMPHQGYICISDSTPSNPYGHTWIHNDDFTICEQNGGNGKGDGLGINAIRLAKAPANAVGFFRPKPMDIQPFQQGDKPKCSYYSVLNCYRLNNGNDARSFTQQIADELSVDYLNKHPHDAFLFLKEKKYNIKYLELDFKGAKTRLNKGSAVILYMHSNKPGKSHFTCCKKVEGKYWIYDSTISSVYALPDIDKPYNEGIFGEQCFQVK